MKIRPILVSIALAFSSATLPAAEPKASTISTFAGAQSGTLSYISGSTIYLGSSIGLFKTSPTRESGTLTLASVLNTGTDLVPVQHTLAFQKRKVTYAFYTGSTPITGAGSVRVRKSKITYSVVAVSGNTVYSVTGTIRVQKKRFLLTETLSGGGNLLLTLSYKLTRQFQ